MENPKYNHKTVIITTLILLSFCFYFYFKAISSVEYSLNKIVESYHTHDTTLFLKYVDINSLTSNYIDNQTDDMENVFGILYDGESKEEIQEQYNDKVMTWVKEGYSKDPILNLLLKKYNEDLHNNKSKFIGILKPIYVDGDTCTVKVKIFQTKYDTLFILDLKLKKNSYHWQLYDIPNLEESINILEKLEMKQKENVRSYMSDAFEKYITISTPQLITKDKTDQINLTLTNISNQRIKSISCQIYFYDKSEINNLTLSTINDYDYDDFNIIPIMIDETNLNLLPNQKLTINTNFVYMESIPDNLGKFITEIKLETTDGVIIKFTDEYKPISLYGFNHFLI